MYDPDEEQDPPGEVDWEAWARNRGAGRNRLWLILALSTMVAMTMLYVKSGGTAIPWAP